HQRLRPCADQLTVHALDPARVKADLADPDLAPAAARRRRGRPVTVEHLHELDPAGTHRCGARVRQHDHAGAPARTRHLAAVVDDNVAEADLFVEARGRIRVGHADPDMVDSPEGAHTGACSCRSPNSTSTARISRRLCSSSTGSRGRRGSPPGWPSIFMIAFNWLWYPPYFPAQPPGSQSFGNSSSVRLACARHASSSPRQ